MAGPGRWDRGEDFADEEWDRAMADWMADWRAMGASSDELARGLVQLGEAIRRAADELASAD